MTQKMSHHESAISCLATLRQKFMQAWFILRDQEWSLLEIYLILSCGLVTFFKIDLKRNVHVCSLHQSWPIKSLGFDEMF